MAVQVIALSQVILANQVAAISSRILLIPAPLDLVVEVRPYSRISALDLPWIPTSSDTWVVVEGLTIHRHSLAHTGPRLNLSVLGLALLHVLHYAVPLMMEINDLLLPVLSLVVMKVIQLTNQSHM